MSGNETTTDLRPTNFKENELLKNFGEEVERQAFETCENISIKNSEEAHVILDKVAVALQDKTEGSLLKVLLNKTRSEDACSIISRFGKDVYESMLSSIVSETGITIKRVENAIISYRFAKLCEEGAKEFDEVPELLKKKQ